MPDVDEVIVVPVDVVVVNVVEPLVEVAVVVPLVVVVGAVE